MASDPIKIIDSVKNGLGFAVSIDATDTSFDNELAPIIDGCLSDLYQKGVGMQNQRLFTNMELTWDDFFNDTTHDRGDAIQYVILKTKVLFDPPLPATINAMTATYQEAIWRAGLEFELL